MNEVYISVDVEAAGPVPGTFSMLAIGACLVSDVTQSFYAELRPINDKFLPEAMKVIGRTLPDFALAGREPQEAMLAFRDWIRSIAGGAKPIFVGFNATFDWAFVNFYFHTFVGDNPFGFGGIDVKSYYMGMSGCAWDDTRSSRIPEDFRAEGPHTHNALDDAIEQGTMFLKMLNRASRKS